MCLARDTFLGFVRLISSLKLLAVWGTRTNMSEKSPSKDEALEALDFIVNVLKEHEKDLDRLVSELGNVAGQVGETGELSDKVRMIEDKIGGLQNDVGNILRSFSTSKISDASAAPSLAKNVATPVVPSVSLPNGLPMLLQCKLWEDFQAMAFQPQTVTFLVRDADKSFEVDALKNHHVISFNGELPNLSLLLKMYLSKQLGISERQILEGDMALG